LVLKQRDLFYYVMEAKGGVDTVNYINQTALSAQRVVRVDYTNNSIMNDPKLVLINFESFKVHCC